MFRNLLCTRLLGWRPCPSSWTKTNPRGACGFSATNKGQASLFPGRVAGEIYLRLDSKRHKPLLFDHGTNVVGRTLGAIERRWTVEFDTRNGPCGSIFLIAGLAGPWDGPGSEPIPELPGAGKAESCPRAFVPRCFIYPPIDWLEVATPEPQPISSTPRHRAWSSLREQAAKGPISPASEAAILP